MKKAHLWIILVVLFVGVIFAVAVFFKKETKLVTKPKNESAQLKGVSLSPKSYEPSSFVAFFDRAAEVGNTVTWAGKWQELNVENNAAKVVIAQAKKQNLTPVIITGPAKDEPYDENFSSSFTSTITEFVKNNSVPYLGIGNEIDQEYLISPTRYQTLLTTLETISDQVKAISPETKIFTIYQLERVKGLQGGLFGKNNDPSKNLWSIITKSDKFDFIAFTTYPCLIYKSPDEIPEEYYSEIANYTTKPIGFTEIGWFRVAPAAGWNSSEAEQVTFISTFKSLTSRFTTSLLIWTYLYDQDVAAPFKHIGLLPVTADDSAVLQAWKNY